MVNTPDFDSGSPRSNRGRVAMIYEPRNPIPVITPMGDGFLLYIKENGMHENDVWTVSLKDGGKVMHFLTNQIKVHCNSTYGIKKEAIIDALTEFKGLPAHMEDVGDYNGRKVILDSAFLYDGMKISLKETRI